MNSKPFDLKRDGGGLLLFVAGTFVAVLMVKTLASDEPLESLHGTAAIALPFADSLGALPTLCFSAGLAFLGARAFVTGSETRLLRHALGLIGCTLGLSILCGSFSDVGGGRVGLFTGGALAEATHATLGGLAGLAALFASVWFVWLRNPLPVREEQIRPTTAGEAELRADPGVSAEEAAGLIPEDMTHALEAARKSMRERPGAIPASPYPEDVRLKGQIPAGATPIQSSHATAHAPASRVAAPELAEVPATPLQPLAPRADLAAPAAAAAALQPAAREVRPLPAGVRPLHAPDAGLSEDRVPIAEGELAAAPARPTWEQTGLSEEDEPVDAYGTPLSLVESLRKAREELREESAAEPAAAGARNEPSWAAPAGDEADEELDPVAFDPDMDALVDEEEEASLALELDPPAPQALAEEDTEELEEEAVESAAPQELDEAAQAESEEFADAEELEEVESEDELEYADEETELADEELEESLAEEESEEEDLEEEVLAEEQLEEQVLVEAEFEEAELEGEEVEPEELEPEAFAEDESPAAEPEPVAAAAEAEPVASEARAVAQTTIFDFTDTSAPGVELFPEPAAAETLEETEPEVVLQPPAVTAAQAKKSPSIDPQRAQLLTEAGCLFVERGRVAVSMLQRQYNMDFDEACKVLDELQDLGLIGPYLGGQRRDILLTRDQWLEKVGAG